MRANHHTDHGGDRCRMFYRARIRAHEANGASPEAAREKALADSQANGCSYVPRGAKTVPPRDAKPAKPAAKPKSSPKDASGHPWHSWGIG